MPVRLRRPALKGRLILQLTVSLKRYPDTKLIGGRSGEPRLYGDSTQSNERVTAFFQK